jgi:hypothetical protein
MSLKEQTSQSLQESTNSKKVMQGLVVSISKMIHELTEDTKMLGEIKQRLEGD